MVDFLGFIIGMGVLWGVLYLLVYPITESFAKSRLEKATKIYGKKINPESIPISYFSFFGSVIFSIIGLVMGLLFGMFFIGFSLRGKDLPGVFSLIVASISGSVLLTQPRNTGFVPFSLGILITIIVVSWYLITQHDVKTMDWVVETPDATDQSSITTSPVSSQLPPSSQQPESVALFNSASQSVLPAQTQISPTTITQSPVLPKINQFCIHCGNRIQKPQNFCIHCGKKTDA